MSIELQLTFTDADHVMVALLGPGPEVFRLPLQAQGRRPEGTALVPEKYTAQALLLNRMMHAPLLCREQLPALGNRPVRGRSGKASARQPSSLTACWRATEEDRVLHVLLLTTLRC